MCIFMSSVVVVVSFSICNPPPQQERSKSGRLFGLSNGGGADGGSGINESPSLTVSLGPKMLCVRAWKLYSLRYVEVVTNMDLFEIPYVRV